MMMAAVSMIDESDEDVISCSFCLCYIGDSDDQKPKFLSCKHAICIDCERNTISKGKSIVCQVCNEETNHLSKVTFNFTDSFINSETKFGLAITFLSDEGNNRKLGTVLIEPDPRFFRPLVKSSVGVHGLLPNQASQSPIKFGLHSTLHGPISYATMSYNVPLFLPWIRDPSELASASIVRDASDVGFEYFTHGGYSATRLQLKLFLNNPSSNCVMEKEPSPLFGRIIKGHDAIEQLSSSLDNQKNRKNNEFMALIEYCKL